MFQLKKMKRQTAVLLIGVVCSLIISLVLFIVLGVTNNKKSTKTIDSVGETFMADIGSQMVMRYNGVIEQRAAMVEALHTTYSSDSPTVKGDLALAAENSGFDFLAFMDKDGNLEMLLGKQVELTDPAPFVNSLLAEKKMSAVGKTTDSTATGIVLIGVPTTPDGESKSIALVAGMANSALAEMLSEKDTDGSDANRFDTHIILSDGSYVLNSDSDTDGNYFDDMSENLGMDEAEAAALIEKIENKMQTGGDSAYYSAIINTSTPRKHLYCAKLENSEWYLVTAMNYTVLDDEVKGLSGAMTGMTIGFCAIIMLTLAALFGIYLYFNHKNVQQLEKDKASAENANKANSEFLSNMSHDIRTPMNAIVGMAAIATANIDDKEQVYDCLKKISLSSRNLLELMNDAKANNESDAEADKKEVDLTGKRILVAEDNDLNWEIAELLLKSAGLEVEHAENGQVCLDKLLSKKRGYYDAILMDIRMPVMNGLETTAYIRGLNRKYKDIPIIAMTADAFSDDIQKCLDCGMNAHISKPIDIEVVKATLAKYIETEE